MLIYFIFLVLLLSCGVVVKFRFDKAQEEMWRTFAEEEKLEYFGKRLPRSFPSGAPGMFGTRFCVSGLRDGEEVICYQFRTMERNRMWCGVVGCQQANSKDSKDDYGAFDRGDRIGGWALLWLSQWRMGSRKLDTNEVLAAWHGLRTKTTVSHVDGGIVIRPRHDRAAADVTL